MSNCPDSVSAVGVRSPLDMSLNEVRGLLMRAQGVCRLVEASLRDGAQETELDEADQQRELDAMHGVECVRTGIDEVFAILDGLEKIESASGKNDAEAPQ